MSPTVLQWLRQASTPADRILLLLLISLLGLLFWYGESRADADTVQIYQGKRLFAELALGHNQQIIVPGPLGDTLVEVRDGQARVRSSPCSGKQCIHAGWLHRAHDSAACIPNQVLVTINGTAEHTSLDAISE